MSYDDSGFVRAEVMTKEEGAAYVEHLVTATMAQGYGLIEASQRVLALQRAPGSPHEEVRRRVALAESLPMPPQREAPLLHEAARKDRALLSNWEIMDGTP